MPSSKTCPWTCRDSNWSSQVWSGPWRDYLSLNIKETNSEEEKHKRSESPASYIHQSSKPRLQDWPLDRKRGVRATEEEQSSSHPGPWDPGPEGLPPTPPEREGWSLPPVTLPHVMPKDFLDPEIILILQKEARPTAGPESPLENEVCVLAGHSLIWKLQTWKIPWNQGLFTLWFSNFIVSLNVC